MAQTFGYHIHQFHTTATVVVRAGQYIRPVNSNYIAIALHTVTVM